MFGFLEHSDFLHNWSPRRFKLCNLWHLCFRRPRSPFHALTKLSNIRKCDGPHWKIDFLMFKHSNAIMYIGNLYITLSLVLVSFPHDQKIEIQVKAFRTSKCIRISWPDNNPVHRDPHTVDLRQMLGRWSRVCRMTTTRWRQSSPLVLQNTFLYYSGKW